MRRVSLRLVLADCRASLRTLWAHQQEAYMQLLRWDMDTASTKRTAVYAVDREYVRHLAIGVCALIERQM